MSVEEKSSDESRFHGLPVLQLRDVVIFPHMVVPLFVGRSKSIAALDKTMSSHRKIILLSQKSPEPDEPGVEDMFMGGTLGSVLQLVKMPDDTIKVLVEGERRVSIAKLYIEGGYWRADGNFVIETCEVDNKIADATMRAITRSFAQYVQSTKKLPIETIHAIESISEPGKLVDTVLGHLDIKLAEKQKYIDMAGIAQRMEKVLTLLAEETDISKIEQKIRSRIKIQMEKTQREYYLNEQMKAIQRELGEFDEGNADVGDEYRELADKAKMPSEVRGVVEEEISRLAMMTPFSAEASVVRGFLGWLVQLPWSTRTRIKIDLDRARCVLDAAHYGLNDVKERVIEYLAVQRRVKKIRGSILCFVGAPGVGKTSLGRSIAEASGRKFARMSLGGVRDEAEIRGHRRTYVGSMPGKIIQQISRVKSKNPLFLLDEVDKISTGYRGDPASALLEVLDPEQNKTFTDHFLEVEFDLSEVLFICTANTTRISPPLLDRMEVIRLPGYTEEEKFRIAKKFLIPKQEDAAGLWKGEVEIVDKAILSMIRSYTKEAGVRDLERCLAKICRKVVAKSCFPGKNVGKASAVDKDSKELVKKVARKAKVVPTSSRVLDTSLSKYLGVRKYEVERVEKKHLIGMVNALAWTEVGGELLKVEASVVKGRGKLLHTGQLGDVMCESAQAALTVVRSRSDSLGIPEDFHGKNDFHIHALEGATPKDGPSAGVSICTALISALTEIPVRNEVAMTGELTLLGTVLKIGGLKEKLLAALRAGIKEAIIPYGNRLELKEIPRRVLNSINISLVKDIDQVLEHALSRKPVAIKGSSSERKSGTDDKFSSPVSTTVSVQ